MVEVPLEPLFVLELLPDENCGSVRNTCSTSTGCCNSSWAASMVEIGLLEVKFGRGMRDPVTMIASSSVGGAGASWAWAVPATAAARAAEVKRKWRLKALRVRMMDSSIRVCGGPQ
jgi:hypothetical protein